MASAIELDNVGENECKGRAQEQVDCRNLERHVLFTNHLMARSVSCRRRRTETSAKNQMTARGERTFGPHNTHRNRDKHIPTGDEIPIAPSA